MNYHVKGTIAQFATLEPERNEDIWASNGSLMSYSKDVNWKLEVPGGLSGAVRRSLSGEGLSLTKISASSPQQEVSISANSPGHIVPWELNQSSVVTTRGSFLAAWGDIDITVTVAKRAGAALFGGAGLFLPYLSEWMGKPLSLSWDGNPLFWLFSLGLLTAGAIIS